MFAQELLEKVNKAVSKELRTFSNNSNILFQETDFFNSNDYIEGIGLDEKLNSIIFSLNKDQVYPQIIIREKAVYIIKLIDISVFDQSDYDQKKGLYESFLTQQKISQERLKVITKLQEEANIQLFVYN